MTAGSIRDNFNQQTFYFKEPDGIYFYYDGGNSCDRILRKLPLDSSKIQIINIWFAKDDKNVYRAGRLLKDIDPTDFHAFNHVYCGNHQIIYTYGDAKVAHHETFQVIDDGDFKHIFRGQKSGYRESYAVDNEFAYYFQGSTQGCKANRIKSCHNPSSLRRLEYGYAADDENAYFEGRRIHKAKGKTFRAINEYYSTDGKHIFYYTNVVEGADVSTFKVYSGEWRKDIGLLNWDGFAADCNHYYENGCIVDEKIKVSPWL